MHLHTLTMTGIGPYAATQTIDFDRFAASGRFLLTGPTGAGKTTIIDAIVFALYGQVADSTGSSKQRLRSTLVGPAVHSEVDLTFSVSAGTYRILRSPEYQRPKKRGTGTTRQNATAKLWRLSAPGGPPLDEPITRLDDVGAQVARIVGLSRDQFTQTVVLPQGRFARFLRATSAERHMLLRDVFGTGIFDAIQEQVAERSRSSERASRESRQALQARVEVAAPLLAALPAPEADGESTSTEVTNAGLPSPVPPSNLADALTELVEAPVPDAEAIDTVAHEALTRSSTALAPLAKAVERARTEADTARAVAEEAADLRRRIEQRRALLAERARLDAQRPAHDADVARLDAARRAAQVTTALRQCERAEADLSSARNQASDALVANLGSVLAAIDATERDAVSAALEPGSGALLAESDPHRLRKAETTLASATTRIRTLAGSLEPLVALERGLDARQEALARHQEALETRRAEADERARALESRPTRHAELESALESARRAEAELPQARVDRDSATARRDAAARAEALEARLEASGRSVREATAAVQASKEHAARQHRAWLAATAGSIAVELVDGGPCPVCGSTDHPHPAEAEPGSVSRSQVEQADTARTRADDLLTQRVREHHELEQERRTALEASGARPLADLDAVLTEAAQRLSALTGAAAPAADLAATLAGFTEETAALRDDLAIRRTALTEDGARLDSERTSLAHDHSRCAEAADDYASVADRRRALLASADAADAIRSLLAAVRTSAGQAARTRTDLDEALQAAGFADAAEAAEAALPPADLNALAASVERERSDRERVRYALTQNPELSGLTGEETVDVEAARARQRAAEDARDEALAFHATAVEAHRHLREALSSVCEAAAALTRALCESRALIRVAGLVAGRNDAAAPLATWVLLDRFTEVLIFANNRLDQMSSGRYELVRVDDETGSAARRDRGLGLGVIDRFSSGGVRDPKTLSGGETFYVSLSLALALADVVTAESGGVSMETLFVDEGFGALDPETLQTVLAELGRLQAGGRTVGIVSHVEELRRQIPDRIEVTRTPSGSSLTITAS